MKKIIILVFICLLVLNTGCSNTNKDTDILDNDISDNNTNEPNLLSINDYYPFKENTKYSYEGEGNEYAAYTVFIDYLNENRIQTRVNNGGTEIVNVIENKDGELKVLLSKAETYYREDFTSTDSNDGDVLLKEPITVGTNWMVSDNSKREITNINAELTTSLGTYKALEVTTEYKNSKSIDYYAKDIGLVKTVNISNDYEISSNLEKIENNIPLTQNIVFYYPDIDGETLISVNQEISFNTNDTTIEVLEKTFKNMTNLQTFISPNVKINKLYLKDENTVHVDFSKEFVDEMNAGAGFENMILQSITNTLGNYFGAEKVYITIDDQPYESGHIIINEDEPRTVNLENVKPQE